MSSEIPIVDPLAVADYSGDPESASQSGLDWPSWRAVENLIHAYSYNWDARQPEATAQLFTDDAEVGFFLDGATEPTHSSEGRDDLLSGMQARTEMLKRWRIETRHLMTMSVPGPIDDGALQVMTTAVIYWQQLPEHPQPLAAQTGYYKSWCVETDSGWRFRKRQSHLSGVFHPKAVYGTDR